jgi:hypothetical protein
LGGTFVSASRTGAAASISILFLFELLELFFRFAVVHGLLEALHRGAEIRTDRAQPLGAEYHQGDGQNDQ